MSTEKSKTSVVDSFVEANQALAQSSMRDKSPINAPLGKRIVAFLIDHLLMAIISIALFWFDRDSSLISVLVNFIYNGYFLSIQGATPGKQVVDLKVVDMKSNGKVSFIVGGIRGTIESFTSVLLFPVTLILLFTQEHKRLLHDFVCGTRVVLAEGNRPHH